LNVHLFSLTIYLTFPFYPCSVMISSVYIYVTKSMTLRIQIVWHHIGLQCKDPLLVIIPKICWSKQEITLRISPQNICQHYNTWQCLWLNPFLFKLLIRLWMYIHQKADFQAQSIITGIHPFLWCRVLSCWTLKPVFKPYHAEQHHKHRPI